MKVTYTFHEPPKSELLRFVRGFFFSYFYAYGCYLNQRFNKTDLVTGKLYEVRIHV